MKKTKFAILLLLILAVSALSLTAGAYAEHNMSSNTVPSTSSGSPSHEAAGENAMPFMSWNTVPNSPPGPPSGFLSGPFHRFSFQQSCVRMDGNITEWETTPTTPVLGMIEAQSRTTVGRTTARQGFSATAIWTTNTTRPIAAFRTPENFTYTFYAARLVNGNYSALDPTPSVSWFMNGTWNVWSVKTNFTIVTDTSGNILSVTTTESFVSLARRAIGNLTVAYGWSSFNLTIGDIPTLAGTVLCYRISSGMFNPFIVGFGSSSTVTPADLKSVASAYGSMPGWGSYNLRVDPCLDFQVDICDLSTAAANLNSP